MKNLTFITGGARSGKSVLAEELAAKFAKTVFYFATMQIQNSDGEQVRRLELHRERRPSSWKTIDAPFNAPNHIEQLPDNCVVVFDCLSLYVTNILIANTADDVDCSSAQTSFSPQHAQSSDEESFSPGQDSSADSSANKNRRRIEQGSDPYAKESEILSHVDLLLSSMEKRSAIEFIVVSNEVGWGVVPESKLARAFRDALGFANQRAAAVANRAYLCCSGLRVELK